MRLGLNVWQESEGMPWFWEVWDRGDPEGPALESGICETEKEAWQEARRAARGLRKGKVDV